MRLPLTLHPGFGRGEAAAGEQTPVNTRREDLHFSTQRGRFIAKMEGLLSFTHGERALADTAQQTKE
ncbi:hypothetical protein D3C75_852290 [compost metagenome]